MQVMVAERWEGFVDDVVKTGRFGSASEVVQEGLRLVKARETAISDLRATLEAAIAEGGSYSDDAVGAYLDEIDQRLAREGL